MSERGERMITEQIRLPNGFEGGPITVGTSRQALVFTGRTIRLVLQPKATNAGMIFVGGSTVATDGSNAVHALASNSPGLDFPYDDDLTPVYVVASQINQVLYVMALTRPHITGSDVT